MLISVLRISPTYTDANILRSVGELRMLYQLQERSTNIDEEQQNCIEKDDDDDIIFNPLNDLENGSSGDCKEIRIDNVALELDVSGTEEVNLNETNFSKESSIVVEATDLTVRESSLHNHVNSRQYENNVLNSVNNLEVDNNNPILNLQNNNDFKEIVETVKNAVLSFRNDSNIGEHESSNNTNVIDEIHYKSCDNLDNFASRNVSELSEPIKYKDLLNNDERCCVLNDVYNNIPDANLTSCNRDGCLGMVGAFNNNCSTKQNHNCTKIEMKSNEVENLEQYNSYNYWYISPEMPLDPSIINAELPVLMQEQNTSRNDSFSSYNKVCILYFSLNIQNKFSN